MNTRIERPPLIQTLPPNGVFSGPPYAHVPSSHKGLGRAIVIILILAVLAGAGVWAYMKFLSPLALAQASSDKYVTALTTDDVDWAAYLSAENADFSLLESAAHAVKGEYNLDSSVQKGDSYYFLYKLTNATNKYARAVVVNTAKGYRVSGFVYSSGALALVPNDMTTVPGGVAAVIPDDTPTTATAGSTSGSGSGSSTGGTTASGSAAKAPAVSVCLAQADYVAAFPDGALDDGDTWTAASPYSVQVSFNLDTTDYADDFEVGSIYATWVQFYQANPTKNYTIHVGSVTYSPDSTLANQRAAKAKAALISVGVPQSKIVMDAVKTLSSEDETDDGYATLTIMPGSGC